MSALEYDLTYGNIDSRKVWEDAITPGSAPPLYLSEIDDILIDKASHPDMTREWSRHIGGPSFFVSVYESQFYHFLMDGLAQFLWLKSFIPDLKIYFINDQPSAIKDIDVQLKKDFVRNIIEWCKEESFGGEIINFSTYKKIKVDKLFILYNSNVTFLTQKLPVKREDIVGDILNNNGARSIMLPLLKEFLFKKAIEHNRLPADFNYPKRVFLRPGLTIERLQGWQDQLDYLEKHGVVFDKDMEVIDDPNNAISQVMSMHWPHRIAGVNTLKGMKKELNDRYLSPEEVQIIDEFFIRREYEFLDSQSMAWIDILNIVIHAEKVALIAGAAILNAIVAGDGTNIIYLDFNTEYQFDHLKTLDLFFTSPKPFIYYDRREVVAKKYDVARVLSDLEQEKGHYL